MKSRFMLLPFVLVVLLFGSPAAMAQENTMQIRVFTLNNMEARNALDVFAGLQTAIDVRVVPDERTNSLIVAAQDARELEVFQELLTKIDVANKPKEKSTQTVEVTLTIVLEGSDEIVDQILPAPTEQVVELIKELGNNPYLPTMKNPRVGGTIMNRVTVDENQPRQFQGSSSSKSGYCQLKLAGRASNLEADRFAFDGNISILLRPTSEQVFSSEMATRVAINKKHPVILGLTSIEGNNCLVILEIR